MKTLFFLLFTVVATAQEYAYFNVSLDVNNAIRIKDNPRTTAQVDGFDFDVEAGARSGLVGIYVNYGRFYEAKYQNYGAGLDLYLDIVENLDTSIGIGYGAIMKQDTYYVWGAFTAANARVVTTYNITKTFGVSLRLQLQQRPDIDVFSILEGSIGITYKINR